MEKVLGIGGLFFRSRNPKQMAKWYTDNLGIDILDGIWHQEEGPTVLTPFKDDTDYFGRDDQQWMINFRVADLDRMIDQLQSNGISVETKAEWDSEIGRFARVYDPEGNPIELWEPGVETDPSRSS